MKTKKNLKNSMKGVAAFSFAAAMVLSLCIFRRYPFTNSDDIRSLGW